MPEKSSEKGSVPPPGGRYGWFKKAGSLPRPAWVLGLVILLAGAQPFLNFLRRPAHLYAPALECAAAADFYCLPTVDRSGGRVAFWQNTESGMGIFLYDSATGKSHLVQAFALGSFKERTTAPDPRRSCLLPWSPDDTTFAFTRNVGVMEDNVQQMLLCHAATGEVEVLPMAVITRNPTANSFFAWLTADSFVYVDENGNWHRVQRSGARPWEDTIWAAVSPAQGAPVFLAAISTNQVVWRQNNTLWTLEVGAAGTPRLFYEFNTNKLGVVTGISFSPATDQFLLSCQTKEVETLWALPAGEEVPGNPVLLQTSWSIRNAVPVNDGKGYACIARKRRFQELALQPDAKADVTRLFTRGNVAGLVPSANGRKLFVLGVASNEFSQSIWSYDLEAAALTCVAPCLEHPRYATGSTSIDGSLILPSGRNISFSISLPVHLDRRRSRRFPLIISGEYLSGYSSMFANCDVIHVYEGRKGWEKADNQEWETNTWALYNYLAASPFVDKNQVYLGAASRESYLLNDLLIQHPNSWKGVLLLNPTELPDVAVLASAWHPPKIFISAGTEEADGNENGIKKFLLITDPVFEISFRDVMFLIGTIELIVSGLCIYSKITRLSLGLVGWLSSSFLIYRFGLLLAGYHKPCSCLWNLTDDINISAPAADLIMRIIVLYLFSGSFGFLFYFKIIQTHNLGRTDIDNGKLEI
jgi:hypothetical protein